MLGRNGGYSAGYEVGGRYRLEAFIGRGGMGEVWRAFDTVLKRLVALKSARTGDGRSAAQLRNLLREAQNAAQPRHPNVVEVHDFVVEDATCWIVMEFVAGPSLAQVIADRPLEPEEAAAIGRQMAAALAVLHQGGVVHGDLTPENVLISDGSVAKLTDFGVSRAVWSETTVTSLSGGVLGKPKYLPPEQVDGSPGTARSDIFSLGATLYAAVEGHSPYGEADDLWAYLNRAKKCRIEPPRRAGSLEHVLSSLLQRNPRHRPDAERAWEMLNRIAPAEQILEELPDTAVRPSADPPDAASSLGVRWSQLPRRATNRLSPPVPAGKPWSQRPPWDPRRRSLKLTAAVLAGVVAVTAGVLLLLPQREDPVRGTPGVVEDVRTADLCQLFDTGSFARYGKAEIDPNYGELNRCDLLLSRHDTEVVDIRAQIASHPTEPDSRTPVRKAGRLTVTAPGGGSDACERGVRLRDGNQIRLVAKRIDDPAPDLCTLADVAIDFITRTLNQGPVPRRPRALPADSLALLDACELLDDRQLRVIPGIDPEDHDRDITGWSCDWRSATTDEGVHLLFNQDNDLSDDGDPVTLVPGVETRLDPAGDGPHTCVLNVVRRTYRNDTGHKVVEYVHLKTDGPQSEDRLCADARKLGISVTKKLGRL